VSGATQDRGTSSRSNGGLLVVTGMQAEAKIAAGAGIRVIIGGGDAVRLHATLEEAAQDAAAILSFGVAGGLAPGVVPGTILVSEAIVTTSGERLPADAAWAQRLAQELDDGIGGAPIVTLAGVDAPVATPTARQALHRSTGAAAVDMESHRAAYAAQKAGIPFAALRVVADPAERSLPPAAVAGMRPDGGVAIGAVLASLARDPAQIVDLVRTALDARKAFASLFRSRQMLARSPLVGEFGEFLFDMAGKDVIGGPL